MEARGDKLAPFWKFRHDQVAYKTKWIVTKCSLLENVKFLFWKAEGLLSWRKHDKVLIVVNKTFFKKQTKGDLIPTLADKVWNCDAGVIKTGNLWSVEIISQNVTKFPL